MFFRRPIFFVFFLALLFLGLFSGSGRQRSTYEAGYYEGFSDGVQANARADAAASAATDGEAVTTSPLRDAPDYRGPRDWGFGIFGMFFRFAFMLFLFGGLMRLIGFGRFGRRHNWHGHHKHNGSKPYEKQPEDVAPDVRTL